MVGRSFEREVVNKMRTTREKSFKEAGKGRGESERKREREKVEKACGKSDEDDEGEKAQE